MEIHAQTLNRFFHQHQIIKHYIDDLPPKAINNRLQPDKWSIHETIAYLCRYHYIFLNRLNRILTEVNPFFELYKPEDDQEYNFKVAKSTGSLLHEMYRIRDEMKWQIEKLNPNHCSRIGTHSSMGKMNISQWLEFFLLHESNQLYKIFKMAGGFWAEGTNYGHVITLPGLQKQMDELAG